MARYLWKLSDRLRWLTAASCVVLTAPLAGAMVAGPAAAQSSAPGGFLETATSTDVRAAVSPSLPSRGPFTFPAPYNTLAVRLTNGSDCGGADCVDYIGYSYWRNTNNHVGSNTMLIFVTLDRARGGGGPTLFSYDKTTDQVTKVGPLFDPSNALSWATGEGWYWSPTQATKLYVTSGSVLYRYDVNGKQLETVFDSTTKYPGTTIWQTHTSNDDKVHSATLLNGSGEMGCMVYNENTSQFSFFAKTGDFDECQIDKSGQWLLIKEQVDGVNDVDNVIVNLATGQQTTFLDPAGAAGHSDNGYGYMVAEDNWYPAPGAVRVWDFSQPFPTSEPGTPPQGQLVYRTTDWSVDSGHISHANALAGLPLGQQYACASNANRQLLPRANEIVCFRLDGSLQVLVVAPVMTDLNASGGRDDYSKLPKGNLDVTGQYFIWTSNVGGGRLDAFVVKVPSQLLVVQPGSGGGGGGGGTGDGSAPTVSITSPTGGTVSGSLTVTATATDNAGVAGVQFKLNGSNLGSEVTSPPYSLTWDTTNASDGTYTLTAVARDAAGNTGVSPAVSVVVSNGGSGGGGGAAGVSWTNTANVTVSGNSLTKAGGCAGCPDAGGVSQQVLTADGYVEFTLTDPRLMIQVGLTQDTDSSNLADVDYAIRVQAGSAEVRENGAYRTDTPSAAGQVFRIAIESGLVHYYKNGALFYTSSVWPTYPLRAVAALLDPGSGVSNVVMGAGSTPTITAAKRRTPWDFDGDGKSDVLWRHSSGMVYQWSLNGMNIIGQGTPGMASTDWSIVGIGDFNGDGKADILWRHVSGSVFVWLMSGTNVIAQASLGPMSTDWTVAGVGDLDGDGKADIVWRHTSGAVQVWLMDGLNIAAQSSPGSISTDWTVAGVGDFDGDGKADILWRHTMGGLNIWFMNGATIASQASPGWMSTDWTVAGLGDFNGDGKADVLWRNSAGKVHVWIMDRETIVDQASPGRPGTDWTIAGIGDFDGDGKSDVLWRHSSGVIYEWLMNGVQVQSAGGIGSATDGWKIE